MDLYSILQPGKPESYISGLNPDFSAALAKMIDEAPPEIRSKFQIMSGARSNERQAELFKAAVQKYGSEQAARKWVAPPGKSMHNKGVATDLTYLDPAARRYAHENASRYNLNFPMKHEPWHIELNGVRGHKDNSPVAQTMTAAAEPVLGADRRLAMTDQRQQAVNPAILGADARQAAQQQQMAMAPPPGAPVDAAASPIGNMLGSLMGGMMPQAQQSSGPRVLQDDSGQVLAMAQGLAEKGKQLKSAFMPDVAGLISLGKRPPSGVI